MYCPRLVEMGSKRRDTHVGCMYAAVFRDLRDIPSALAEVLKMNQLLSSLNQTPKSPVRIRLFAKAQDVKHPRVLPLPFFLFTLYTFLSCPTDGK